MWWVVQVQQKKRRNTKRRRNRWENHLKIELYPENKPRYDFFKGPVSELITKDVIGYSLNLNQELGYIYSNILNSHPRLGKFYSNVPVLCGF